MTAYYDTLIVTFSDPIRILDMMCTDTCDVATLKEWIESYESTRMTPINEHTAVITSEYNMVHVVEWLRKYTHEILFYIDRQQGRMDAVRLPPYGRLCVRLYP